MGSRLRQVLAWLAFLAGAGSGGVGAEIIQITDVPNTRFVNAPSINADGRYITFDSNGDFGGLNPTPMQNVFVYQVPAGLFTRVTSQGGSDPTINADGRWVAFTSSADYVRRNADGSDEIFRYDRARRAFYQVTQDRLGDGASALPVIDGSGKEVAYETTSNIRTGNPDLSPEVYLLRRGLNRPLSRDPVGDGESHSPTVSSDGMVIAFQSTSNLTGANADLSQELMVYDVAKRRLMQITNDPNGNGDSGTAALSGDGRFLAFVSSSNVAGLNPDGASAVYVMNRPARAFTVVTKTAGGVFDGDVPSITADGRWIAFVTNFDVTRGNPDHNAEIVVYDRIAKTFTQVTDSTGCLNSSPKFSADGTRIAFLSKCDYAGRNGDHSQEIFLADNPLANLVFHSEGPVSLTVEDPAGFPIGAAFNLIPRASYVRGDFNGDGQPEVRVTIPQALVGPYHITMTADTGAAPDAPVTVDVSLNGVAATLASDTVGALSAQSLSFDNQGFAQRSARMVPASGRGSSVRLTTRLGHSLAAGGPVRVRFTDGIADALFDLGPLVGFAGTPRHKSFAGVVNGFATTMGITPRLDGTAVGMTFAARNGDLSAFAGPSDVSMVMIVQIGPDTSMYYWRFKRQVSGALLLTPAPRS